MRARYDQDDLENLYEERRNLIKHCRGAPNEIAWAILVGIVAYYVLNFLDFPTVARGAAVLIAFFVVGFTLTLWNCSRRIKDIDKQIHEIRLALSTRSQH